MKNQKQKENRELIGRMNKKRNKRDKKQSKQRKKDGDEEDNHAAASLKIEIGKTERHYFCVL